jgi:hypothetical protein
MEVHYFQRYSTKENVSTANTVLLLSRIYSYSPDKFFSLIKGNILSDDATIEMRFSMQEGNGTTVPDATIKQESFKVIIETKLYNQFGLKQLVGHLESFGDERYKVLLTLDPRPIKTDFKKKLELEINKYNLNNRTKVTHKHMTFKDLIAYTRSVIDERDNEMLRIIDDFEQYCEYDNLIPNDEQKMRVQLAGTTIQANKKLNLYYDSANRGYSDHAYLGLYTNKSVRLVGKLTDIIHAKVVDDEILYDVKKGTITDDMKDRIKEAIEDGKNYGYDIVDENFFFVDKFYDTDFKKTTPYPLMGTKMFNLVDVLGVKKLPDSTEKIAEMLKERTWGK